MCRVFYWLTLCVYIILEVYKWYDVLIYILS